MIGPTQSPKGSRPAECFYGARQYLGARRITAIIEVLYASKNESTQ